MSTEATRAVLRNGLRASGNLHLAKAANKKGFSTSINKKASVAAPKASAETIESHLVSLVQTADYPSYL